MEGGGDTSDGLGRISGIGMRASRGMRDIQGTMEALDVELRKAEKDPGKNRCPSHYTHASDKKQRN